MSSKQKIIPSKKNGFDAGFHGSNIIILKFRWFLPKLLFSLLFNVRR